MGLFIRGKAFLFIIQHEGRRIQRSTGESNKRLAENIYAKVRTDINEGKYFEKAKAKIITFSMMAEKYLEKYEKSRDRTSLVRLLPFFGHLTLN